MNEETKNIINVLEDINSGVNSGKSLTQVCAELGVNYDKLKEVLCEPDSYKKLYEDVISVPHLRVQNIDIPKDYKETIEYLIHRINNKTIKNILKLKYGLELKHISFSRPMTDAEIGRLYGMSVARIGEIIRHTFWELRRGTNRKILQIGITKFKMEKENKQSEVKNTAKKAREEMNHIMLLDDRPTDSSQIENIQKFIKNLKVADIGELDLSARSYNNLHRAGIMSVYEFVNVSYDDLLKINGVGRVSLDEAFSKLESYLGKLRFNKYEVMQLIKLSNQIK